MNPSTLGLRCLRGLAAASGIFVVLVAGVGLLLQAGFFRTTVIHWVERGTGRAIQVDGPLRITLFAAEPTIAAERLVIGNPSWVPSGRTAEIARLTVVFRWPGAARGGGISRVELEGSSLHLTRDVLGHANWQFTAPDAGDQRRWPIIRSLSMRDAHLRLDDARRHLVFEGAVSAFDAAHPPGPGSFELAGTGMLNGRQATFAVSADALESASHAQPYRFHFEARSSGASVTGSGSLPHPFDFREIDAAFESTGRDLKDLYFLAGVSLVNTGNFELSGQISARGSRTTFDRLNASFGSSDVEGRLAFDSSGARPILDADVESRRLRLADLGLRAAGREAPGRDPPGTAPPRLLFPEAALNPSTLRRIDGSIRFHAGRLDLGVVPLYSVSAAVTLDHAVVTLPSFTADVLGGRAVGTVRMDATPELPVSRLELRLDGLHLDSLARQRDNPPIEGAWTGHVSITGAGMSLHQAAASASGTVTVFLPHGSVRSSLAELAGLDIRGLGLLLSKSRDATPIRCADAEFTAASGILTARKLVFDTEQVLLTGSGTLDMHGESLDLQIHGFPKHTRLFHIRSAMAVRGTLLHPSLAILGGRSSWHLVDPGSGTDVDCAARRD